MHSYNLPYGKNYHIDKCEGNLVVSSSEGGKITLRTLEDGEFSDETVVIGDETETMFNGTAAVRLRTTIKYE